MARAPPPAPGQPRAPRGSPSQENFGIEARHETLDIGIRRAQHAAVAPKRVGGADRRRQSVGADSASTTSLCGTVTFSPT